MNRFMARWLREVVAEEETPTFLYWFFFRESYEGHWQHQIEQWRKNTERKNNG